MSQGAKESSLSLEDVATFSPRSGKRSRDDKDGENLLPTDLSKESAPVGDDGNGGDDQATQNPIISQTGKRIKCDPKNSQLENSSKKGDDVLEDQFYCIPCSVKCTSAKDYDTHVAGKRHARTVMAVSTPRSRKVVQKSAASPKAKVSPPNPAALHEDVSMKEQASGDGFIISLDEAGKGLLSSCTGCTDTQVAVLQAFQSPDLNDGKDASMEQQQHFKEGAIVETLGSQVMKNVSTNSNGKLCEPVTNGNALKAAAGGLAKCGNMEGQHNKSVMDFTRGKSNSECIARALAAAYQVCPCPGLEGLLKSGAHNQAAGSMDAASANATDGMVSMHTPCFMNLLHDVQVKAMEELFLHVVRDEKVRGFSAETWLTNLAPVSPLAPCAEDLNCTVCRVEYGSKSDLDRHVMGKKHLSLVTRLHARCQVCNVNCNSEEEYKKHVSGKKHGSKLRLAQKRGAFVKLEG